MTSFSKLTGAAILLAGAVLTATGAITIGPGSIWPASLWPDSNRAWAVPPRTAANRPVVIEVPIPDAEPPVSERGAATTKARDGFLAVVLPDDSAGRGKTAEGKPGVTT